MRALDLNGAQRPVKSKIPFLENPFKFLGVIVLLEKTVTVFSSFCGSGFTHYVRHISKHKIVTNSRMDDSICYTTY